MANEIFEYDVFISFASADEALIKPIWQELSLSGVRVFWSDATLRDRVGASWFDVVQAALDRSRHLLLVCTKTSLRSEWVKREYVAFYNHCYRADVRRLVPLLTGGTDIVDLPLFLREIEACRLEQPDTVKRLIQLFGGTDVSALRRELVARDAEIQMLKNSLRASENELNDRRRTVAPEGSERKESNRPKLYLRRTWRLSNTTNGAEDGAQYLVGSEFDSAEISEENLVGVRTVSGEVAWIRKDIVCSEDLRTYFKIKERGIKGYLVGHMTDMRGDGTLDHIVINDAFLGKSHVNTKMVRRISIRREDDKDAVLTVETRDGGQYEGTSNELNHWGTYFVCGGTLIALNTANGITLEAVD